MTCSGRCGFARAMRCRRNARQQLLCSDKKGSAMCIALPSSPTDACAFELLRGGGDFFLLGCLVMMLLRLVLLFHCRLVSRSGRGGSVGGDRAESYTGEHGGKQSREQLLHEILQSFVGVNDYGQKASSLLITLALRCG